MLTRVTFLTVVVVCGACKTRPSQSLVSSVQDDAMKSDASYPPLDGWIQDFEANGKRFFATFATEKQTRGVLVIDDYKKVYVGNLTANAQGVLSGTLRLQKGEDSTKEVRVTCGGDNCSNVSVNRNDETIEVPAMHKRIYKSDVVGMCAKSFLTTNDGGGSLPYDFERLILSFRFAFRDFYQREPEWRPGDKRFGEALDSALRDFPEQKYSEAYLEWTGKLLASNPVDPQMMLAKKWGKMLCGPFDPRCWKRFDQMLDITDVRNSINSFKLAFVQSMVRIASDEKYVPSLLAYVHTLHERLGESGSIPPPKEDGLFAAGDFLTDLFNSFGRVDTDMVRVRQRVLDTIAVFGSRGRNIASAMLPLGEMIRTWPKES